MGAHSCELFCNLGLCCLYGGQLDLVFPCFQRAIRLATTPEQRADVWYNLSFVALVSSFISIIYFFWVEFTIVENMMNGSVITCIIDCMEISIHEHNLIKIYIGTCSLSTHPSFFFD